MIWCLFVYYYHHYYYYYYWLCTKHTKHWLGNFTRLLGFVSAPAYLLSLFQPMMRRPLASRLLLPVVGRYHTMIRYLCCCPELSVCSAPPPCFAAGLVARVIIPLFIYVPPFAGLLCLACAWTFWCSLPNGPTCCSPPFPLNISCPEGGGWWNHWCSK